MMKYEKKGDVSYTLGTTLTFELLLRKPEVAKRIYISEKQKRDETYDKLVALAKKNHVAIIENNQKIFSLSEKENTFVIGEFQKFHTENVPSGNHVILVSPSNMGNLGTIFRSCAAFDIDFLGIIRPAADAFDPKCIRSTMGAIFSLPFAYFDSFEDYQKVMGERYLYPFMLQTDHFLKETKKEKPYSLIFGNEATGLPDSFLKVGTPIKIVHSSKVESLNLDNAVSIGIYSFLD